MAIGGEIAALGDNLTSDFWGSVALAFDTLAPELPSEVGGHHQNFDLVVFGNSHLPGFSHKTGSRTSVPVRVFLRFHDDDREPIGLFVTYNEHLLVYPGQDPVAESITVARGLTRIKFALGESGEGATPSSETGQAIEAALRQRMIDRLV